MTLQELVDKTYQWHIVDGNPPGFDPVLSKCCYRTSDGARCAVGVGIPDEDYRFSMESTLLLGVIIEMVPELPKDVKALERLQAAHDICCDRYTTDIPAMFWKLYPDNLRGFCLSEGLVYPGDSLPDEEDASC